MTHLHDSNERKTDFNIDMIMFERRTTLRKVKDKDFFVLGQT